MFKFPLIMSAAARCAPANAGLGGWRRLGWRRGATDIGGGAVGQKYVGGGGAGF